MDVQPSGDPTLAPASSMHTDIKTATPQTSNLPKVPDKLKFSSWVFTKLFSPDKVKKILSKENVVQIHKADSTKRAIVADVGTGNTSIRLQVIDPKTGHITSGEEKEVLREKTVDGKKQPKSDEEFAKDLINAFEQEVQKSGGQRLDENGKVKTWKLGKEKQIIYLTSHARGGHDKEGLFRAIQEQAKKSVYNIEVKILSQEDEAAAGHEALMHFLNFKDPNNEKLKDFTTENTMQFEVGKGSAQSHIALQKQTIENAGNWGNDQLKSLGKEESLDKIVKGYKDLIQGDLKEIPEEIQNLALQGLLGVGSVDNDLLKTLGLDEDLSKKWAAGQHPINIDNLIKALEAEVKKLQNKRAQTSLDGNDIKRVVPLMLTLGTLQALREKYNKDFNVICLKAPSALYLKPNAEGVAAEQIKDSKGKTVTSKPSGSLGVASKYFKAEKINKQAKSIAEEVKNNAPRSILSTIANNTYRPLALKITGFIFGLFSKGQQEAIQNRMLPGVIFAPMEISEQLDMAMDKLNKIVKRAGIEDTSDRFNDIRTGLAHLKEYARTDESTNQIDNKKLLIDLIELTAEIKEKIQASNDYTTNTNAKKAYSNLEELHNKLVEIIPFVIEI